MLSVEWRFLKTDRFRRSRRSTLNAQHSTALIPALHLARNGGLWADQSSPSSGRVEDAACEAQAEIGVIPKEDAGRSVRRKVQPRRSRERAPKTTKARLPENVASYVGPAGRWCTGMTSSDVLDHAAVRRRGVGIMLRVCGNCAR